jgi:hypothetical protein
MNTQTDLLRYCLAAYRRANQAARDRRSLGDEIIRATDATDLVRTDLTPPGYQ